MVKIVLLSQDRLTLHLKQWKGFRWTVVRWCCSEPKTSNVLPQSGHRSAEALAFLTAELLQPGHGDDDDGLYRLQFPHTAGGSLIRDR